MNWKEYATKNLNLKDGEYEIVKLKEQAVCMCGAKNPLLRLLYIKGEEPKTKSFPPEWSNCHCSCGLAWEQHPIGAIRWEDNPAEMMRNKKDKCMDCRKDFENTEENYQSNGNFCATCSTKHAINAEDALRKPSYQHPDVAKKMLDVLE